MCLRRHRRSVFVEDTLRRSVLVEVWALDSDIFSLYQAASTYKPKMSLSKSTRENIGEILDTIDNAASNLRGISYANLRDTVLEELPQFVSVGAQSAGKSSVIRRISGISLPEAATCCTKIATSIQLRRDPTEKALVELIGPNGTPKRSEATTIKGVETLVTKFQSEVTADDDFCDDHHIRICVSGPDQINLTLVDLPGFHTEGGPEKIKKVKSIVEKHVRGAGTSVLHVCRGDQDYGSLVGNDFVCKTLDKHPRVTVLTHCDTSTFTAGRLSITYDKCIDANSDKVFLIDGRTEPAESQLKKYESAVPGVSVGVDPLKTHLEERIADHLRVQLPKAQLQLQKKLDTTNAEMVTYKHKEPADVVQRVLRSLEEKYLRKKKETEHKLREELLKMQGGIKGINLVTLHTTGEQARPIDKFDEIEPGMKVFWEIADAPNQHRYNTGNRYVQSHQSVPAVNLWEAKSGSKWFTVKSKKGEEKSKKGEEVTYFDTASKADKAVKLSDCSHIDDSAPGDMVEDILSMADDRGLRNLFHIDRQPIIEAYAGSFAAQYGSAAVKCKDDIVSIIRTFYAAVFSDNDNQNLPVITRLHNDWKNRFAKIINETEQMIKNVIKHNTVSELVFSSNEHYLNELIRDMVAADKEMATDDGGARHIYHHVRAYLKTQKKHVCEVLSKEIIRILYLKTNEEFENVIRTSVKELADLVKEPKQHEMKRAVLEKRVLMLNDSFTEVERAINKINNSDSDAGSCSDFDVSSDSWVETHSLHENCSIGRIGRNAAQYSN